MFASRFREAAARALLLPRRRPDRRTPLWQQRQKAADLLAVAAKHPTFPILLEATRECCNDVFDLPALRGLLRDLRSRKVQMVAVDTAQASPMASSLLFGWIAVYMYEGDAPLAERRAAALALDRDLLRELLGAEELRDLLDPLVLADLEAELQRLVPGRLARDADEIHDLLRVLGPLTTEEAAARCAPEVGGRRGSREAARRPGRRATGHHRGAWPARRTGPRPRTPAACVTPSGCAVPVGLPGVFTDSVDDPLGGLVVPLRPHPRPVPRPGSWRCASAWSLDRVRPVLDAAVAAGGAGARRVPARRC